MTQKYSKHKILRSPAYDPGDPVTISFCAQYNTHHIKEGYIDELLREQDIINKVWQIIGPAGLGENHELATRIYDDVNETITCKNYDDRALEKFFFDHALDYVDVITHKQDHKRCIVEIRFETACVLRDTWNLDNESTNALDFAIHTSIKTFLI